MIVVRTCVLRLLGTDKCVTEFTRFIPTPDDFGFGSCLEWDIVFTAIKWFGIEECKSRRNQV